MRRMGGSDAFFLDAETPRAYMHTFKIAIIDPGERGWSFDAYRERLRRRLDRLPVFRWRYLPSPLGLSYPVWVDDPDFNLDYHIRRVGCPAPGDQRALCEFMSAAYAYQLDRSRPLWTTWVVEGLQGGKVALVTLIHHAYFDGAGASNAMRSFFDPAPLGQEDPEPPPWNPPPLPGWTARLLNGAASLPGILVRGLPPAISGLRKKRAVERAARAAGLPPHPSPELMPPTPLNRTLSHGRTLVCESLPLERLQQARQGQQFTINDVFLSCTAGALRRLLQEMGHAAAQPLVAGVPISNAREPGKELYGNFASVDYCWLHIEIADPLERLRASQATATRMKEHIAASQGADIGAMMRLAPPWITRLLAWSIRRREGRYGLFGNVVVSNVPGPSTPLYFGEAKIDNWFSTGQVFEGSSLNITLWSYCGKANVCILGDSQVLPEGWRLFGHFCTELDALVALAPRRG